MVLMEPGMIVNFDEDLPGFNFQIGNDSRLTQRDCDEVGAKLMSSWLGARVHTRLDRDQNILIMVTGPLTVDQYRMVTQEIKRETDRIEGAEFRWRSKGL
jgi:hypothetical protein